jgi:hypothetical protein
LLAFVITAMRLSPARGASVVDRAGSTPSTVTLNYIEAAFRGSPMLSTPVAGRVSDTLRLTNGIEPVCPAHAVVAEEQSPGLVARFKGTSSAARRFRDLDRL